MPVRITPKNNGSLLVEGDFEIVDVSGNAYDLRGRTKVTLCRCGASKNKPFCDSSHRSIGFSSECTAFALPPPKQKQQD